MNRRNWITAVIATLTGWLGYKAAEAKTAPSNKPAKIAWLQWTVTGEECDDGMVTTTYRVELLRQMEGHSAPGACAALMVHPDGTFSVDNFRDPRVAQREAQAFARVRHYGEKS